MCENTQKSAIKSRDTSLSSVTSGTSMYQNMRLD